ncbi:hypothetical protein, partial [Mesorhizobium sp.]|uniref:hypothetical protein n=1 Tax=Mesorhizobium sp. TaxID=1871066 RepID=UPI0025D321CF
PQRGAPSAARALREFPEASLKPTNRGLKMKTKFAASVLSVLLYAQGLLGFAALATVLLKDRAHAGEINADAYVPAGPSMLVVR